MNTVDRDRLFNALQSGPAVLFLGQQVLAVEGHTDFFFQELAARLNRPAAADYTELLSGVEPALRKSLDTGLRAVSQLTTPPEWLVQVGELPWNAVVTSAFHEVIERAFASDLRKVVPLLSDDYTPADPLNRHQLHLTKLFGCVTGDKYKERPPLEDTQRGERQADARKLLDRLPSQVTPRGVLVIDGYDPEGDWLSLPELYPYLLKLGAGQAHWFSRESPPAGRYAKVLADQGKVTYHPESFAEWVRQAAADNRLPRLAELEVASSGGIKLTGVWGKPLAFTPGEWRKFTQGLPVLSDDSVAAAEKFDSDDARYHAFREFLKDSGVHPPRWADYAHGFAFRRQEARELTERVFAALAEGSQKPDPIVVGGQSGSGKTVALAHLAFQARQKGWPVIHLPARQTPVHFARVNEVCENLERLAAPSTLLVWDAQHARGEYVRLARFLANRGRNVLVVGSAYLSRTEGADVTFMNVLGPEDEVAFAAHLRGIERGLTDFGVRVVDRNFFTLLYRRLPPSRRNLEAGLRKEWGRVLLLLQARAEEQATDHPPLDEECVKEVWQAVEADDPRWRELWTQTSIPADPHQRLEGAAARAHMARLILVPGRYGVGVPVDLAVRAAKAVGVDGFEVLRNDAFYDSAVFFWEEDARGNSILRVRSELEAGIICDSDFVQWDHEVRYLRDLVTVVRVGIWDESNAEVEFLTRLFDQIEPDADPHGYRFRNRLDALIAMLTALRERNGNRVHPQLALREANLRRHWLFKLTDDLKAGHPLPTDQDPYSLFTEGRELIQDAEAAAEASPVGPGFTRVRSQLLNELACLYGSAQMFSNEFMTRCTDPADRAKWQNDLERSYPEAMDACRRATIDPHNAHPADVRFWVSRDRYTLRREYLSEEQKADLIAEMCDALAEETWVLQPEKFLRRQHELGKLRGDERMSEEALKALHATGSHTGHYLVACERVYDSKHQYRDADSLRKALSYLEGEPKALDDLRVLRLYQNVWWRVHGDVGLFDKDRERVRVKLTAKQWQRLTDLLLRRLKFPEEAGNARARFLLAWALFQCGKFQESIDLFKELEQMPRTGREGTIRRAVWCDNQGRPVPCQGTIRQFFQNADRGWVFVPAIDKRVPFLVDGFKTQELRLNGPLQDFHIAFNFGGPIADPVRFYKDKDA